MDEFGLIERIRSRAGPGSGVALGIGDDAALLTPTPGHQLAVTTDSVVLDRHFTADWPAEDVGHLAANANLSDLAAMGAEPRWALLALTLPEIDDRWIDGFLDGFLAVTERAGMALVGGNLARGALNIGVELIGELPSGRAVTRSGAKPGDQLVVTGTVGDAAAVLALGDRAGSDLRARLRRPTARIQAGLVLRESARAMIDLSDGLLADLNHLLHTGLGAEVDFDAMPTSTALGRAVIDPAERFRLQAGGGSDYELLAVLSADADLEMLSRAARVELTPIGIIREKSGITCRSSRHEVPADLGAGWDHFRD